MKKKVLSIIFSIAALCCFAFGAAGCELPSAGDETGGTQNGQTEPDGQGGNQGDQGSQGDQGEQGGNQGEQGSQGGNQEHKHSGDTWEHDETSHWKICDECGETFDKETHSGETMGYDETSHWKICEECEEEFDKEAHSGETMGHDETSHWKICDECNEAFAKETHSGETWVHDETSHWKVCDECGETFAKEAHNLEGNACSVCGYSEKFTDGLIFELDEESNTYTVTGMDDNTVEEIVIPSYYLGKHVTRIGANAFKEREEIKSVTIPYGVIEIGGGGTNGNDGAFQGCTGIKKIILPESLNKIGDFAFKDCTLLSEITIPDSVTYIGYMAFFNTAIYNEKNNWSDQALYIGDYLIIVENNISGTYRIKDNTKKLAYGAFMYCTQLTGVEIPEGVEILGYAAFGGCTGLTSVIIPNSVKEIGELAFIYCRNLVTIKIGDGIIKLGESAFYDCRSLISIKLPDGVMTIGGAAFENCTSLTNIEIPDSVTTIGWGAFFGASLTEITYQGTIQQWDKIKKDPEWNYKNYIKTIHCKDGDITL